MDPAGSRFAVGSTDNTLRMYDFGGMDRLRLEPFKMLQADEGHVVSGVCYSNTGDRLLVGTGSSQPYVLDRDGAEM
jgi:WD40 repeat protein